jgi:hypothetical protein
MIFAHFHLAPHSQLGNDGPAQPEAKVIAHGRVVRTVLVIDREKIKFFK